MCRGDGDVERLISAAQDENDPQSKPKTCPTISAERDRPQSWQLGEEWNLHLNVWYSSYAP
jgi:hypothetical protein